MTHSSLKRVLAVVILPALTAFSGPAIHAQEQQAQPDRQKARAACAAALDEMVLGLDQGKARAGFLQAIGHDPSYAPAYYNLGLLEGTEEKWDDAISCMEKVKALVPGTPFAKQADAHLASMRRFKALDATPEGKRRRQCDEALAMAMAYLGAGDARSAMAEAARAVALDGTRWMAYSLAARALMSQGRFAQAEKFLERAIERAPESVRPKLSAAIDAAVGERLMAERQYAEAARRLQKAYAAAPEQEMTGYRAALAVALTGEPDRALALLTPLFTAKDKAVATQAARLRARIRVTRAIAAEEQTPADRRSEVVRLSDELPRRERDVEGAQRDVEFATGQAQKYQDTYNNATTAPEKTAASVMVIITGGELSKARRKLQEAQDRLADSRRQIDAAKATPSAALVAARFEQAQEWPETEIAYRAAFRKRSDGDYARRLGAACEHQGDWTGAALAYKDAARRSGDASCHALLGHALLALRRYADAEEAYRRAANSVPKNGDYQRRLGDCLALQGKWKEAIDPYRKASRSQSKDAVFAANLGYAYYQAGQYGDAGDEYKRAVKLNPTNGSYWAQLAGCLQKRKKRDAKGAAEKAMQYGVKDHWVLRELGLISAPAGAALAAAPAGAQPKPGDGAAAPVTTPAGTQEQKPGTAASAPAAAIANAQAQIPITVLSLPAATPVTAQSQKPGEGTATPAAAPATQEQRPGDGAPAPADAPTTAQELKPGEGAAAPASSAGKQEQKPGEGTAASQTASAASTREVGELIAGARSELLRGTAADYAPAISSALEAIRIAPECAAAHAILGSAQLLAGESPKLVRKSVEKALPLARTDQDKALGQLAVGLLAEARLKQTDAVTAYEAALALDPTLALAHCRLCSIALDNKRTGEAELHIRLAIAADFHCGNYQVELSRVLLEKSDQESAKAALMEAKRLGYRKTKQALEHFARLKMPD